MGIFRHPLRRVSSKIPGYWIRLVLPKTTAGMTLYPFLERIHQIVKCLKKWVIIISENQKML